MCTEIVLNIWNENLLRLNWFIENVNCIIIYKYIDDILLFIYLFIYLFINVLLRDAYFDGHA